MVRIREAGDGDREAVWGILEPVIRAGETYTLARERSREGGLCEKNVTKLKRRVHQVNALTVVRGGPYNGCLS